jgi:hypothetical protein
METNLLYIDKLGCNPTVNQTQQHHKTILYSVFTLHQVVLDPLYTSSINNRSYKVLEPKNPFGKKHPQSSIQKCMIVIAQRLVNIASKKKTS